MREFLRAKIHGAAVTGAHPDYQGSFGIDLAYLKKLQILPYEAVEIYNISNGARLKTYAIALPEGSQRFESNGAAARLIQSGDRVIIACYQRLKTQAIAQHKIRILVLGQSNQIVEYIEASPMDDQANLSTEDHNPLRHIRDLPTRENICQ